MTTAIASTPRARVFRPTDGAEPASDPLQPDAIPAHADLLKSIQGNMLKSHGRSFVRLVLFRFDAGINGAALRALLADAVSDTNADAVGTTWKVTSAYQQWDEARHKAFAADQPFYSLGLSYQGLRRCGYPEAQLPLSDVERPPRSTGFGAAMNDPAVAGTLGDRVSPTEPTLPDWEKTYREGVDGVWLLAHADPAQLGAMERRVTDFLVAHRAHPVAVESGGDWTDVHGHPREPFGFRDGISDPIFFHRDCQQDAAGDSWVPAWVNIPRRQVLITGGPHAGGSFLVLRKLEQNVTAFRELEQAIQHSFGDPAPGAVLPREAGALLIGRERDGSPLAEPAGPSDQNIDQGGPNRFDFGTGEARCPFHAHIRKSAPRVPVAPPAPPPALHWEVPDARSALFVRRSAVYDTYGQLPPSGTLTDDPAAPAAVRSNSYASRHGGDLTREVGLLFMGYMSNIVAQFQKLQSDWFGSLGFPCDEARLADPVIRPDATVGSADVPRWRWPMLPRANVTLPPVVTPRGGAYFYVPSITWLRQQTPPPADGTPGPEVTEP
jgi:deferrochelatase/peroxidase EfeB